jgi:hypothetical protein
VTPLLLGVKIHLGQQERWEQWGKEVAMLGGMKMEEAIEPHAYMHHIHALALYLQDAGELICLRNTAHKHTCHNYGNDGGA